MEQKRLKTAIIGVGRWGKNVARELADVSELAYFASESDKNDAWAATALPQTRRASVEEISADAVVDAVAIATPVATHEKIARRFLEAGKHVFVEKPLTETSAEAYALAALAQEKGRILMTGYTLLYHPVYQELKRLIQEKGATRIECTWKKHGTFFDIIENALLTHHLSIAYDLYGMPESASVTLREAGETVCDRIETKFAYKQCEFISKIDRLSEEKAHTIEATLIDGTKLRWDDTKLYKGEEVIFESTETSLTQEVRVFIGAAGGGAIPRTAGDFGAHVLKIHEMLAPPTAGRA
ncbi:Gfo/Idh/MocA family oxidoreductase [Candidatus Kaiserbacteria bacterium]|nr:Gfo/Idh/MocA family oxidoreductase [Candidatus Kaiserbacteria bacterium]